LGWDCFAELGWELCNFSLKEHLKDTKKLAPHCYNQSDCISTLYVRISSLRILKRATPFVEKKASRRVKAMLQRNDSDGEVAYKRVKVQKKFVGYSQ